MIYSHLKSEQVTSVHNLYVLLRSLGVIGVMHTQTVRNHLSEEGGPFRYKLVAVSYDASMKGKLTAEERFTRYFIASDALEYCIRQTE